MRAVDGAAIDLNLFVVFDAIYAERSVTRAAERLHLSQPAVSHSLGRLRSMFDDPLFERQGRTMVPTPVAHQVIDAVREALALLDGTLVGANRFDPATATRHFTIGVRNHLEVVLLPELTTVLLEDAPGVSVSFVRAERRQLERELSSGVLDAAIDVLLPLDDAIRRERIRTAPMVVAARRDHPALVEAPRGLDLDGYLAHGHVQVSGRRIGMSVEDFELSRHGLQRDVRLRCQTFAAAWHVIRSAPLLLTLAEPYAATLVHPDDGVVIVECPVPVPPMEWHLYWHDSRTADPANQWLRNRVESLTWPAQPA